ncbi:class I SAM-dependent methyltransferase [Plantactinospora sp. DSM 117369]
MRSFGHWTPRYFLDRTRELRYSRSHPDAPWLTPQATQILSTMLRPSDQGVEFGSGRSTLWLSQRVRHLTSVEHDDVWHGTVSARLKAQGVHNVDHLFAAPDVPFDRGAESEYVRTLLRFDDSSLDFALVDGIYRDACAQLSLGKLRPGGLLIVDNVERFLPSLSRSPGARRPAQGPASQVWAEVARAVGQWRHIWTCSGVWDTAIFIKP